MGTNRRPDVSFAGILPHRRDERAAQRSARWNAAHHGGGCHAATRRRRPPPPGCDGGGKRNYTRPLLPPSTDDASCRADSHPRAELDRMSLMDRGTVARLL